jgi:UDP-N-acetylmuramyl pentapeptide phosphotransferase/UDP-N-acetylglucosamine-1-phosphate transferase
MAVLPFLPIYVFGSILTMACASSMIPLITQVYQENYPEEKRGQLFSRTVMIRIGTAAILVSLLGAGFRILMHSDGYCLYCACIFGYLLLSCEDSIATIKRFRRFASTKGYAFSQIR